MRLRFSARIKPRFGLRAGATRNLGDARSLFDERATIHRLGRENLADASLLDDGVVRA